MPLRALELQLHQARRVDRHVTLARMLQDHHARAGRDAADARAQADHARPGAASAHVAGNELEHGGGETEACHGPARRRKWRWSLAFAAGRNLKAIAVEPELEPEPGLVRDAHDTEHGRRLTDAGKAIHLAAEGSARIFFHGLKMSLH